MTTTTNYKLEELKQNAKDWVILFFWLFVSIIVYGSTTDLKKDYIDNEELQEQILDQGAIVYKALKNSDLVPQETLDEVAILEPELEDKRRAKQEAWSAIGPRGKIKDAGVYTSAGREWREKLDEFKAVDRKMTITKDLTAQRYGSKLIDTDAENIWQRYKILRDTEQEYKDNRPWYDGGFWGTLFFIIGILAGLAAFGLGFFFILLSFNLVIDLVSFLTGDD